MFVKLILVLFACTFRCLLMLTTLNLSKMEQQRTKATKETTYEAHTLLKLGVSRCRTHWHI